MRPEEECAAYFRGSCGFERIFAGMLKKYQGLGRVGGTVALRDATAEELRGLYDLFGQPFSKPVRVSLVKFEQALQKTRFAGVSLPSLLAAYYGTPIQTRQEERAQRTESYQEVLAAARAESDDAAVRAWLDALGTDSTAAGGRILRGCVADGSGRSVLRQVCNSFTCLQKAPDKPVRLAVLSAQATTDPHALDEPTATGKLFLALLCFQSRQNQPEGAQARDELFYRCGILRDSISSTVTQIGAILETEEGEHPAYAAFRQRREVCTLTLSNLGVIRRVASRSGHAYLVENQMVFSHLCDHASAFHSPLICTSGQPQVAVLRLLDLLVATGTVLHYSGDFDVNGLSIAEQLWRKYPGQLCFWHMDSSDYFTAKSKVRLPDHRLALLAEMTAGPLGETAQTILREKYAGYQELLLGKLSKDLISTP